MSETVAETERALSYPYPIAEEFTSIQGEGLWAGTLMRFVRLAGCCVGKPLSDDERKSWSAKLGLSLLPRYIERCTTYDGRSFLCDTDFRGKKKATPQEILDEIDLDIRPNHLCITGGEPLMHDLKPLIGGAHDRGMKVHIETSGTIWKDYLKDERIWVTVSPKAGVLPDCLRRADEVKFLVDEEFHPAVAHKLVSLATRPGRRVWIQPINGERTVDFENVKRCLLLLTENPDWGLSIQLHKVVGVR